MEEKIEITITVNRSEYKEWDEFQTFGTEEVMHTLKREMIDACKKLYIRTADVEARIIR